MVTVLYVVALCSFAVLGLFVGVLTVYTRLLAEQRAIDDTAAEVTAQRARRDVLPAGAVEREAIEAEIEAALLAHHDAVRRYNRSLSQWPARPVARLLRFTARNAIVLPDRKQQDDGPPGS